jgi:hypothetical protein
MKVIFFLILSLGVCSCSSTRNVKVSHNDLEVPQLTTEIKPIQLKEVHFELQQCMLVIEPKKKVFCITEQNLINDIENINTIRKAYNELILKHNADKSYYEDILNKK